MSEPPLFLVHPPRAPEIPVLATIPHSGTWIPLEDGAHFAPKFLKTLPNTDWHLNKLFSFLPSLGVTVLEATHSRYLIDLNRNPNGTLLGDFWTALVAEKGARGETIHSSLPDEAKLRSRIERFHAPYHAELKGLLESKIEKFGKVYLLDLHSFGMPIGAQVCLGPVRSSG
jgi:N-formylglutamate deformylase